MKLLIISPLHRRVHRCFSMLALLWGMALMTASLHAQVIYQQLFTNPTGINQGEKYVAGWTAYSGTGASDKSINVMFLSNLGGNPASPKGFLALNTRESKDASIFAAVGSLPNSIDAAGSTISWAMGNNHSAVAVRLLVRVNGEWYASSQTFANAKPILTAPEFSEAAPESVTQTLRFSTASSNWFSFTLKPGEDMSLGSALAKDLPSSQITGIGFLITTPRTYVVGRFDTLTITKP